MNKEITTEDIIKAIDEMFDEKKLRENETFWRGYNYGITRVQQYIVKLNQEIQRKDNIINGIKKALKDHKEIKNKTNTKEYYIEVGEVLDKIKELEKM